MEVRDVALSWRWIVLAALAATLAVVVVLMAGGGQIGAAPTSEPTVSYEELTRIIGPVAI